MKQPKKQPRATRKIVFGFAAVCIVGGSAMLILKAAGPTEQAPATTASVARNDSDVGFTLVPDGNGMCNKFSLRNNTASGIYEGTVPCDISRPRDSRANLPPVLRGMQDNLRR